MVEKKRSIYYTVTPLKGQPIKAYETVWIRDTNITQPPYSYAACLASGRLSLFTESPGIYMHSQRNSMVRYTTGAATRIRTQSQPAPSDQRAGMLTIRPRWSVKRRGSPINILTPFKILTQLQRWNKVFPKISIPFFLSLISWIFRWASLYKGSWS